MHSHLLVGIIYQKRKLETCFHLMVIIFSTGFCDALCTCSTTYVVAISNPLGYVGKYCHNMCNYQMLPKVNIVKCV